MFNLREGGGTLRAGDQGFWPDKYLLARQGYSGMRSMKSRV